MMVTQKQGSSGARRGPLFILKRGMEGLSTRKPLKKGMRCSPTGEISWIMWWFPLLFRKKETGPSLKGMQIADIASGSLNAVFGILAASYSERKRVRGSMWIYP